MLYKNRTFVTKFCVLNKVDQVQLHVNRSGIWNSDLLGNHFQLIMLIKQSNLERSVEEDLSEE